MNSFGQYFRITIFGESHGEQIGVVVDGCPAGMALQVSDFLPDLHRRQSGAMGTTARKETDVPRIVSGVYNGYTTGAAITLLFENRDVQSKDYDLFRDLPRPGHADFAAAKKWNNYNDLRGGGAFSGRLTVALVAAGVIAKKIIAPIHLQAKLIAAGGSKDIAGAVENACAEGDTIGGVISCVAQNISVGFGSPFFNSIESMLSHLIFSIPGVRAIEFGAGVEAAAMKGSEHNDRLLSTDGKTATNHAGGVNGGLTNGNDLLFRVIVKPASGIAKTQHTMNVKTGKMSDFLITGRHDTCLALRMPVIVEAATAIVLADFCKERGLYADVFCEPTV